MHRLKAHIRSLEKQDGIRHLDLRRVVNRALEGGDGRERFWEMVRDNNLNKRFATEIENEMDGQRHKNYPKTVKEMWRLWNASPEFFNHFGGEFIEKSAEEILLDLMRQHRGKPKKKPDDSKPKKKKKSKKKKTGDDALREMRNRINGRRAGKK